MYFLSSEHHRRSNSSSTYVHLGVTTYFFHISECLRKYVSTICLPSAKIINLPSHQVFSVFALEVNKILQATPSKLRRGMGMCATTIYVQQQQYYTPEYDTSTRCTYSSRKSCHASVSVMLEKRGGRCRTDGPIRVLSSQMRHTIAAIKAAWCRSLC